MPMAATEHFGTNNDGSISDDFCCFCFQKGGFTDSFTLEEFIDDSLVHHNEAEKIDGITITKNEAALKARLYLSSLKRWSSHKTTHQEYYKAVNTSLDYIDKNLSQQINLADLAAIANISGFHFHRIFKAVIGESPGDYILRLRMEKAAFKLQATNLLLAEIAEQVGYQSAQALSKAFKKHWGVSPSTYKRTPIDLTVKVEDILSTALTPRIETLKPIQVIYTQVNNPYHQKNAFTTAWTKLAKFMKVDGLPGNKHEYYSLSNDISSITEPEMCRVYVCISNYDQAKPSGIFGIKTINGGLFAVFTHKGSYKQLDSLYCKIYRSWVLKSEYELRDTGFFEKYLNSPNTTPEDDLLTEIYIPITRT